MWQPGGLRRADELPGGAQVAFVGPAVGCTEGVHEVERGVDIGQGLVQTGSGDGIALDDVIDARLLEGRGRACAVADEAANGVAPRREEPGDVPAVVAAGADDQSLHRRASRASTPTAVRGSASSTRVRAQSELRGRTSRWQYI
ncbi:hypothetical protein GCM10009727_05040 [Actinomadura napierensis]|uniref:Uncharacterized protein n=1 Tax=Actinomadura napierensis TaxID=267854 RepID=A0ABP5JN51_9ACTN